MKALMAFLSVAVFLAAGYWATAALAAEASNLKVYTPETSKAVIKKDMKKIARALGVQCDFCHEMPNFAKDTRHKEQARTMMRMVQSLNAKELAESHVTCDTCHRGHAEPTRR